MSVGTIENTGDVEEQRSESTRIALSGEARNERRVLAATTITMVSLIGLLIFTVHMTMQDYVVQLGPWF